MFKRLLAMALVFGAAALAPPVAAQAPHCMPRDALTEILKTHYGETLTGGGLQSERQLLEVWSSDNTGSFTIFLTRPDGTSCILATGRHWHSGAIPADKGLAS